MSFQKIANSSSQRQGFEGTIAAKAKQPLGDQDGYAVYMSNRFATKYVGVSFQRRWRIGGARKVARCGGWVEKVGLWALAYMDTALRVAVLPTCLAVL